MIHVNINTRNDPNVAQLLSAVAKGDLVRTKSLIESGTVSVNAKGENGYTPFMEAVKFGRYSIAEYLRAQGADLNATNDDGETAFSMAVTREDLGFAILLFENDAAKSIMDKHGIIPFALETDDGCSITFGLMQENGTVLYEKKVPYRRKCRTTSAESSGVELVRLSQKPIVEAPAKNLRFHGASAKKRTSRKCDAKQPDFFNELGLN